MDPQLTQIADGIHRLGVRMSGLFILIDDAVTLVDTGPRWSSGRIAHALKQLGRSIEEVERVIVTHAHFDHFGSVAAVVRRSDAEVHAHATDAGIIAGRRRSTVPAPQPLRFLIGQTVGRLLGPGARVDVALNDGDRVPALGAVGEIEVVHTPGHTAGHVALLVPQRGVLLTGDSVQVTRRKELVAPYIYEDRPASIRSLIRLAQCNFDVLAPSHFAPETERLQERLLAAAERASAK